MFSDCLSSEHWAAGVREDQVDLLVQVDVILLVTSIQFPAEVQDSESVLGLDGRVQDVLARVDVWRRVPRTNWLVLKNT